MSYSCQKSSERIRRPHPDYLNCGAIPIRPCRHRKNCQRFGVDLLSLRSVGLYLSRAATSWQGQFVVPKVSRKVSRLPRNNEVDHSLLAVIHLFVST